MGPLITIVRNAERMMIQAAATPTGIEFTFADGCRGLVPYSHALGNPALVLKSIQLANPFKADLLASNGEPIELPWDFVRHYCDAAYEQRASVVAAAGRQSLGTRIRAMRKASRMTQSELARDAGIGRVTEARIEAGEQSPRYDTLLNIARALGRPVSDLLSTEVSPSGRPPAEGLRKESIPAEVRDTQAPYTARPRVRSRRRVG